MSTSQPQSGITASESASRTVHRSIAAAFVGAVLLGSYALWRELQPPPRGVDAGLRNLLLVTFDTTRADRIGAYGYTRAHTPNIDRMARSGVTFDQCIATAPITLPSHASILSGLYPYSHGARNNGTHNLPEDVTTLAETLSEEGFATGAVVSALVLDSKYGLDQGFGVYDDNLANADKSPMFMFRETKALDTAQRALRWIQAQASGRWFLWVHFFDPHANYMPPEHFAKLCPSSAYDGEIAYADAGLGEILEGLRLKGSMHETLVVMTADHGESLGEHGESTHSTFVYDSTTHVPLVMMHPALVAGKRIRGVVSTVDIAPTALDLLDIPSSAPFDGRSAAEVLLVRHGDIDARVAYSEAMSPYYNHGWSDLRSVRSSNSRYIRAPRPELYALTQDPWEQNNLLPSRADLAEPAKLQLSQLLGGVERDERGEDILAMAPEQREALAALGYVWSDEAAPTVNTEDLADPKDTVHLWEKSQRSHDLIRRGRYEEAESALLEVLAEQPDAILPRTAYVGLLVKQDRLGDARAFQEASLKLPGARNTSWLKMAYIERQMGLDSWRTYLDQAKAMDPRDPLALIREGDWAQEDNQPEQAIAAYEAALAIDERAAKAFIGIGNTLHRQGEDTRALEVLQKATQVDPIAVEAWYNLGVVHDSLGQPKQAEKHYLKAIELDAEHVLTLVNLGGLATRAGKPLVAKDFFRRALAVDEEDFSALFNLALSNLGNGAPKQALDLFDRATQIDPGYTAAWHLWIQAAAAAKDAGSAAKAALGLSKLKPTDPQKLTQSALRVWALGLADEAAGILGKAMELDPKGIRTQALDSSELAALLGVLDQQSSPRQQSSPQR